tara:strand:- start:314 stop:676 length:363 start_codon:yes stop_codon:yes gene_type:complete
MGSFKSKFKANRYRKPKKELTNLNDDDICYICWEQEKKNTKLIKSPCDCGMLVHGDCLRSYLKSSKRFQCSVCEDFLMNDDDLFSKNKRYNLHNALRNVKREEKMYTAQGRCSPMFMCVK